MDQVSRGQVEHGFQERGIVQRFLEHGIDINTQAQDHLTPFHSASPHERLGIAPMPLYHDANVNLEGDFGRTPLNQVAHGTYNFQPSKIASTLHNYYWSAARISTRQTKTNATPLHLASCCDRVEIARLLLDRGAAANSKGNQGRTPLHSVAEGRYLYSQDDGICVAQLLLERGADVNALDEDNKTPLHLASYYKKVEIARALLDGNAATNSKDNQGRTPLHVVAEGYSGTTISLPSYYWSAAQMSTRQMTTTKLHCIWHLTSGRLKWYWYCSTPVQIPAQRTPKARPHYT